MLLIQKLEIDVHSMFVELFAEENSTINASNISDVSFPSFGHLQHQPAHEFSTARKLNPTSKRTNNDKNEASKRAKQSDSIDLVSGDPVLNSTPAHPSILKTAGESFYDYYKHLADYDDSAMKRGACLNWHICGRCNPKCARSSSHGPLTPDLVTSVQKFAEKCRMLNK